MPDGCDQEDGREAYEQGRRAFRDGIANRYNPHPCRQGNSLKRLWWFKGWYDEKYNGRFERKYRHGR